MPEEFEGRDLSDAVFWGVDLSRATFRDVLLKEIRISHAMLIDVDIDAFVDRVVINGVDVTQYVNDGDPWYPLRAMGQVISVGDKITVPFGTFYDTIHTRDWSPVEPDVIEEKVYARSIGVVHEETVSPADEHEEVVLLSFTPPS